jgi:hypothetical protein
VFTQIKNKKQTQKTHKCKMWFKNGPRKKNERDSPVRLERVGVSAELNKEQEQLKKRTKHMINNNKETPKRKTRVSGSGVSP